MPVGVRAVELADGFAGVGEVFVGYEGGAGGAAGAVEAEGEGEDGADAGEEVLDGRSVIMLSTDCVVGW